MSTIFLFANVCVFVIWLYTEVEVHQASRFTEFINLGQVPDVSPAKSTRDRQHIFRSTKRCVIIQIGW